MGPLCLRRGGCFADLVHSVVTFLRVFFNLADNRVWHWLRQSSSSGAEVPVRRVALSPDSACMTFAHLLSLLLDIRHANVVGFDIQVRARGRLREALSRMQPLLPFGVFPFCRGVTVAFASSRAEPAHVASRPPVPCRRTLSGTSLRVTS